MPAYSFYALDPSGNTSDYLVRTYLTDHDACDRARQLLSGSFGIEIWDGRRLVSQITTATSAMDAGETIERIPNWPARHLPALLSNKAA